MKAIQIQAFGGTEQLKVQDVAVPQLKAGQVMINTTACGVNPIDWKTCSGGGAAPFIGDLPFVPGWELSGVVDQVAEGVDSFQAGDVVFGFLNFPERAGCFAEQVAASTDHLAKCPSSIDPVNAGGLALAGLTAWQALFDKGGLTAGQNVLITAAAGGVGHLAVQLAKQCGAQVTVTASAKNHDYLTSLGADHCIDYTAEDVSQVVTDMDVILDGVGGDSGIAALACLKQSGVLVTLPSVTKDAVIAAGEAVSKRVEPIRVEPNGEQLAKIAALVDEGKLNLTVAQTFKLEAVADAFDAIASGHTRGKVILTL